MKTVGPKSVTNKTRYPGFEYFFYATVKVENICDSFLNFDLVRDFHCIYPQTGRKSETVKKKLNIKFDVKCI